MVVILIFESVLWIMAVVCVMDYFNKLNNIIITIDAILSHNSQVVDDDIYYVVGMLHDTGSSFK